MATAPGHRFLPASQRATFAEQFEKDLEFFQLLFALVNKSSPIKNIDLMWRDSAGSHRAAGGHHVLGTTQALENTLSGFVCCEKTDPNPRFCNLVQDHGNRYSQSCAISDRAAMERVGETGKSEVYRCHAGLVDIAVPVMCEGRQIATLFSGQVLRERPQASGLVQIREEVRHLSYIDMKALEEAYYEVPVVSEEDIQRTVRILETFADYLSTCWTRLREAIDTQRSRLRAAALQKKELAHLLLEGDRTDRARLRELARGLGFAQYPNRVLVVRPEDDQHYGAPESTFDLAYTNVLHAVEDLCERSEHAVAAHLRRKGICVFFRDRGNSAGGGVNGHLLGQRILAAVAERCDVRVRIGIGRVKNDWCRLRDSYHEAWSALAESSAPIAIKKVVSPAARELSAHVDWACGLLATGRLEESRAALLSLSMMSTRGLGERGDNLVTARRYLCSALEAVLQAASKAGGERSAILNWRSEGLEALEVAPNSFELDEAWGSVCDRIIDGLGRLYAGKHEKLVERVQRLIEHSLAGNEAAPPLSLPKLAAAAGVSGGHLSRTFKRVTGTTLERYLMVKRVERAKRLLLDPASRVSEVAEKCDFCNPAYFARVFRKIAGRSPSEYSRFPNGNPRESAASAD